MNVQPTLATARLLLRPMTFADAPEVQRLAGEYAIAANALDIPYPYPPGAAEAWIAGHEEGFLLGEIAVFGVVLAGEDRLIGAIGLMHIDRRHQRGELGYWIGKPYWNRGYATEAASAIIAYGFAGLGLNRIYATHFIRNPASGRVLEKCGLVCEGRLRQHVKKWEVFEDVAIYGIVREDYRARGGAPDQRFRRT
ncbi:GNAT family N-acetyltransferase [Methanoculleus sp. FWC-SCC1]|uniref:GNAT family N-acetyltransferase n=1 Tax=Methanoculleus frigidifontis TaxID=2584085 RepID=A0ABT8MA92_9EURY|nr:GNAT family N-acetyltransferase [Methanoculleus sp. FWC-SCC1]MDN7024852.1 GNAT family N-acetyltransferase [Methanoculleus sp. FWC-SCC1]